MDDGGRSRVRVPVAPVKNPATTRTLLSRPRTGSRARAANSQSGTRVEPSIGVEADANLPRIAKFRQIPLKSRRRSSLDLRRDLSALARYLFWALLALIVFGIVLVFVQIPNGDLIYAVAGLVIFAGLTLFDFQRLRRTQNIRTAPLLAASIFLDVLNVFLLFLSLFGSRE